MLTLREILTVLEGRLLTPGISIEAGCPKVFASDLMSDVLAFMDPGSVLLTGLVNSHVVRTASLADVAAIVIVQGKQPDMTIVGEAIKNGIPIISTECSMFEACSRISQSYPESGS